MLLRAWANFSDCGFFKEGFSVLGRSVPFPSLIGFFPSFCQALAEDRVTTPTKKKKKKGILCAERNHVGMHWHSGTEHSAHLGHYQYHTGHRWGITLIPIAVSKRRVWLNTKSEMSCTANDTTRQVEKHVFGKDVRRMSDQIPSGRQEEHTIGDM